MKLISTLIALVMASALWSQSLSEAAMWFEKYEYARSAEIYSEYAKINPLPKEDYERLGYAYFVIGDYKKAGPIADSLIKMKNVAPFFHYIHGEISMATGKYAIAKESFEKYETLDSEYNVATKIQSCDLIPTWSSIPDAKATLAKNNTTKADISGGYYNSEFVHFKETGLDSLGGGLQMTEIDNSELILAQPFLENSNGISHRIVVNSTIANASIISMVFLPNSDNVLLTISQPMAEKQIDMVPHIYKGTYNPSNQTVDEVILWEYSGYEDSTSCAHATVNSNGDKIVFTKIGNGTNNSDLFVSNLLNNNWSKPSAISKLNTELDEMYPMFIGDSLLSFSSNGYPGYGGLDVFTVNAGDFSTRKHLKEPVNSFMDDFNFIYSDENNARFTSNRKGGQGDDDIYLVNFGKKEPIIEVHDSSGFIAFVDKWTIPKVYFNFDKFDIEKDIVDIKGLVNFLSSYPSSKIVIEGHTDSRGTSTYNFNLGYSRAQAVKYALVNKGIAVNQIEVVSKGRAEQQVDCSSGCSEEDHAKNRVALIKLIAK